MKANSLDFEQPLVDLENKIQELQTADNLQDKSIQNQLRKLSDRKAKLTKQIFNNLSAWQIARLARHHARPSALDFINVIFTDFDELHGDRRFKDDAAIVGGLARFNGKPVMVIGQEKGKDLQDKIERNFGMSRPEGYRKTMRLFNMAEKFGLPVFNFIDTSGAYPGIGAEERGQSAAIAENLARLSHLRTQVISCVIGQGGSGGALALGVADKVLMLEYSIYSVISPEGCASILWRSSEKADEAAEAMGITAARLKQLGIIDEVVKEPLGGAHKDKIQAALNLKEVLEKNFAEISSLDLDLLLEKRYDKIMAYSALN